MRWTFLAVLCASFVTCPAARAAEEKDTGGDGAALLMDVLVKSDDPQLQLDILRGVRAALEGRRHADEPRGWAGVYAKLGKSDQPELRALTRALAAVFGDERAIADMRALLQDASADMAERAHVLQSLLVANDSKLPPILLRLLAEPPPLRDAALQGLASFDASAETPKVILSAYDGFDINSRRVALNTLAGRLEYARPLAAAVRAGTVPKQDLTAFTVRQLRDLEDSDLNKFVDEVYGVARDSSADTAAEIARYKALLTDQRLAQADPARGRALFVQTCAQCHKLYGVGGGVGPDLTGSQRANLDYVLTNILDPSALISHEYQVTLIRTKDKRVVSGIATENEHAYRVVTEVGAVLVPREEVDKVRKSELSMMPQGLFNGRSEADVADLVAYLRTTEQVPLPGEGGAAK